jgi:putative Holliday junction resolvase
MTNSSHAPSPAEEKTPQRVLAIDYGRRRLGLAVSDVLRLLARPLTTLTRTNRRQDLDRLGTVVREHGVAQIVVGLPLGLDGTPGEMAKEARAFATRLEKALRLPVEMVDERLTSWEAEQDVAERTPARRKGERRAKRRPDTDSRAAALILEEYLRRESAKK